MTVRRAPTQDAHSVNNGILAMMNTLVRQCSVEHILLDVDIRNTTELFETIAQHLIQAGEPGVAEVASRLKERESLGSTGLGHGVAIPHARIPSLPKPVALFLRTTLPIPFDAPDGKPVGLFFVLLVPEHATREHLQRLADAASLFNERGLRDALHGCANPEDVRRAMREWSES